MVTPGYPSESATEPQAFRIRQPSNRNSNVYLGRSSPQARSLLSLRKEPDQIEEPTSWLPKAELASTNFNAHDFLQRTILQCRDRVGSKIPHLPLFDSSIDADSALTVLDTVETTLRTHRDKSVEEETLARDKLRKSLHLSSQHREELSTTCGKVHANVTTFGDVGIQATRSLQDSISTLSIHISSLNSLVEARDLVTLLTGLSNQMDAVHVSKLLAKATNVLDAQSSTSLLSTSELAKARREIEQCRKELIDNVFKWMRDAVDTSNNFTIKDCVTVTTQLGVYDRFVEDYVEYIVTAEDFPSPEISSATELDEILEPLASICWDAVNTVRSFVPTIIRAFPDPVKPLALLIRLITKRKVISYANRILDTAKRFVQSPLPASEKSETTSEDCRSVSHTSSGMLRESRTGPQWIEEERRQCNLLPEKKRYLLLCIRIFRSLCKFKSDVAEACRVPELKEVEFVCSALSDVFMTNLLSSYLEMEKSWLEDHLATAFLEVSCIESRLLRFAPTERSDPSVFHRYSSFYTQVTSKFQAMTVKAIDVTHETLCRLFDICDAMTNVLEADTKYMDLKKEENLKAPFHIPIGIEELSRTSFETFESRLEAYSCFSAQQSEEEDCTSDHVLTERKVFLNIREVVDDVLKSLVAIYVANAETVLQAATPLLPIPGDVAVRDLWTLSTSPLTAYVKTVELLSQSNEILAHFVVNLRSCQRGSVDSGLILEPKSPLNHLVSQDARDVLYNELTSGLGELGAEAQQGVRSATSAVQSLLQNLLFTSHASRAYSNERDKYVDSSEIGDTEVISVDIPLLEPTDAILEACNFLEQQILFVVNNVNGGNRDFILCELGTIARDTILQCWCSCPGIFSLKGSMQIIADGRTVLKTFQNHGVDAEVLRCLPAIAQLFLETADGLWTCVESSALADVDARILVKLLKKRPDSNSEGIIKVCQSLGATIEGS